MQPHRAEYGLLVALIRFLFISMTIRYVKAVRDPATRLAYCLPGPLLFIAGWALIFTRQPPALSLSVLFAGSAAMRIQASMIEKRPGKSFRNAAIIVAVLMAAFVAMQEYLWVPVGVATAIGLFLMQRHHDNNIKKLDYRSQVARAQAMQARQTEL